MVVESKGGWSYLGGQVTRAQVIKHLVGGHPAGWQGKQWISGADYH